MLNHSVHSKENPWTLEGPEYRENVIYLSAFRGSENAGITALNPTKDNTSAIRLARSVSVNFRIDGVGCIWKGRC